MAPSLRIVELSRPLPDAFVGMTFARYREQLTRGDSLALGLFADEAPAGLALADMRGRVAEVLSLFVAPELQRRGAGTALLAALEEDLARRGIETASARFNTELPGSAAFARILAKRGWRQPQLDMRYLRIASSIADEPWVRDARPTDGEIFAWSTLTSRERAQLEADRAHFDPQLWPFDADEPMIEPASSVGLRKNGVVIGYMITHRVAPDAVRYTSLFVRADGQRRLRAERSFAILTESIRRQHAATHDTATGTLAVRAENAPMLRILERRVAPHALATSELRIAAKRLR